MALPELPDDRRAQPRRYGAADPTAAPRPPVRSSGPGDPARPGDRPPLPPRSRSDAPPRPGGRTDDRPTDVLPTVTGDVADPSPIESPTTESRPGRTAEERPTGRRRRYVGESPTERPASTYRQPRTSGGKAPRSGRRRRPTFWRELPILVVVALVLTFLIQTFLAKVYVIPSGSMETTLHGCAGCTNDRVLVDKVTYRFSDPKPGDVVVFRGPDTWRNSEFTVEETANPLLRGLQGLGSLVGLAPPDEKDFVKRVIAVGGQTVSCCDSRNRLMVDGSPLDEPYIYYLPEAGPARQSPFGPVTVPDGELWMMGDSRNNSADSRVPGHGAVPIANVIGQVRLIVMPFSRFRSIPSIDPHAAAVGMAAGAPDGAPAALGLLGVLPWALRRSGRARRDLLDEPFLPPPARRRRPASKHRGAPGGGARLRDTL